HNLDTLGIICRSLDDLALLRAALVAGPPHKIDRTSAPPRIGICRAPAWERAEPATQALIEESAARRETAGARVSKVHFAARLAIRASPRSGPCPGPQA